MATKTKKETGKTGKKKKIVVAGGEGAVHIQATSNNTLVSLTDSKGNLLAQSSAGALGHRGAKKGTPFAAQQAVETALKDIANFGVTKVGIYIKGSGNVRDTAIRAVGATGVQVLFIKDVSPIPHNGCRPPKARRI